MKFATDACMNAGGRAKQEPGPRTRGSQRRTYNQNLSVSSFMAMQDKRIQPKSSYRANVIVCKVTLPHEGVPRSVSLWLMYLYLLVWGRTVLTSTLFYQFVDTRCAHTSSSSAMMRTCSASCGAGSGSVKNKPAPRLSPIQSPSCSTTALRGLSSD